MPIKKHKIDIFPDTGCFSEKKKTVGVLPPRSPIVQQRIEIVRKFFGKGPLCRDMGAFLRDLGAY